MNDKTATRLGDGAFGTPLGNWGTTVTYDTTGQFACVFPNTCYRFISNTDCYLRTYPSRGATSSAGYMIVKANDPTYFNTGTDEHLSIYAASTGAASVTPMESPRGYVIDQMSSGWLSYTASTAVTHSTTYSKFQNGNYCVQYQKASGYAEAFVYKTFSPSIDLSRYDRVSWYQYVPSITSDISYHGIFLCTVGLGIADQYTSYVQETQYTLGWNLFHHNILSPTANNRGGTFNSAIISRIYLGVNTVATTTAYSDIRVEKLIAWKA